MPFAIGLSSAFRWGVGSIFPLSLNLEGPAALLQPPECSRADSMPMLSRRLKRPCMLQLTLLHLCLHRESVTLMGQAIVYELRIMLWKKKKARSHVEWVYSLANQWMMNENLWFSGLERTIIQPWIALKSIFLGYQFISNEHNSETTRWKKYIGQGVWEGVWNVQTLSKHTAFPYIHMLTNPAAPP